MRTSPSNGDLVEIEFLDHQQIDGSHLSNSTYLAWGKVSEITEDAIVIHTWEPKDAHRHEDDGNTDGFAILKSTIKRIRKLR
jgi:hypothetical protein